MRGPAYLTLSALCFALATVAARMLLKTSSVPVLEITFFRFFGGLVLALWLLVKDRQIPVPANPKYVFFRAIFNTGAVFLFFSSLQFTTVAKANMLNMTYPVFVVMLAPLLNQEKNHLSVIIYLVLAMIGVALVMFPGDASFSSLNMGDLLALISGLVAAFAIAFLRQARKYDSSVVIIFYLMATGTCINAMFIPSFIIPGQREMILLGISTILSVAGQVFITEGYQYISAAGGSIVSSSRIPFAVLGGYLFLAEVVTLHTLAGSVLIILALAGISGLFTTPLTKWGKK